MRILKKQVTGREMGYKKAILIASGGLFLAMSLSFASCSFRRHRIDRGFDRVSLGDSHDAVISAMGHPDEDGKCGQVAGVTYHTLNCVQEFVYDDPFPLIDGYIVLFDESGHVVDKSRYSSP